MSNFAKYMENILEIKKPKKKKKIKRRINWYRLIAEVPALNREFVLWCGDKNRKIRSIKRLAYLFLKSKYGNKWISEAREKHYTDSELMTILKTPMFKFPEYDL